jgi:hypothetical protein
VSLQEATDEVHHTVAPEETAKDTSPLGIASSGAQITDEMVHVKDGAAAGFGAGGAAETDVSSQVHTFPFIPLYGHRSAICECGSVYKVGCR